jgi:hypothetical protein
MASQRETSRLEGKKKRRASKGPKNLIVAQIFNLLYRRVALGMMSRTVGAQVLVEASAECNSAIRQIANLRYGPSFTSPTLASAKKIVSTFG